jgi:putative modified peptide
VDDNEPFVEIRTSPDRADEFIQKLINDEGFRARLEENPEQALAEYDIRIAPELLAGEVELPSPEQLEEALTAMDAGEFSPETAHIKFMKFWPIFWAIMKFRKFRSPAS